MSRWHGAAAGSLVGDFIAVLIGGSVWGNAPLAAIVGVIAGAMVLGAVLGAFFVALCEPRP